MEGFIAVGLLGNVAVVGFEAFSNAEVFFFFLLDRRLLDELVDSRLSDDNPEAESKCSIGGRAPVDFPAANDVTGLALAFSLIGDTPAGRTFAEILPDMDIRGVAAADVIG